MKPILWDCRIALHYSAALLCCSYHPHSDHTKIPRNEETSGKTNAQPTPHYAQLNEGQDTREVIPTASQAEQRIVCTHQEGRVPHPGQAFV